VYIGTNTVTYPQHFYEQQQNHGFPPANHANGRTYATVLHPSIIYL